MEVSSFKADRYSSIFFNIIATFWNINNNEKLLVIDKYMYYNEYYILVSNRYRDIQN